MESEKIKCTYNEQSGMRTFIVLLVYGGGLWIIYSLYISADVEFGRVCDTLKSVITFSGIKSNVIQWSLLFPADDHKYGRPLGKIKEIETDECNVFMHFTCTKPTLLVESHLFI